jgi:hypothetical protein
MIAGLPMKCGIAHRQDLCAFQKCGDCGLSGPFAQLGVQGHEQADLSTGSGCGLDGDWPETKAAGMRTLTLK